MSKLESDSLSCVKPEQPRTNCVRHVDSQKKHQDISCNSFDDTSYQLLDQDKKAFRSFSELFRVLRFNSQIVLRPCVPHAGTRDIRQWSTIVERSWRMRIEHVLANLYLVTWSNHGWIEMMTPRLRTYVWMIHPFFWRIGL